MTSVVTENKRLLPPPPSIGDRSAFSELGLIGQWGNNSPLGFAIGRWGGALAAFGGPQGPLGPDASVISCRAFGT